MPKLRWDSCLDTGIEEIDWEHRRLVNIANRLIDAVDRGRGEAAVRPVIRDLVRHAEEHFAHEEAYMRDMGYPSIEDHMEEHQRMYASAQQFAADLDSDTPPRAKELSALLTHWLLDHILKIDKHYAAFSREKLDKGSCS